MGRRFALAVVGVGRIGVYHALHAQELGRERGDCELVAVVDSHADLASTVAGRLQATQETRLHAFRGVAELVDAGLADGAMICSRTEDHYPHARALVDAGLRVAMEKPLTDSLETARRFSAYLDADDRRRQALMQAFMRRFDAPLRMAKEWVDQGRIGAPFKVVSILEDPVPPPVGYRSPGLLADMAVHNIDEVIWLLGERPLRVQGFGARLYNHRISPVAEDFDDAFLQLWLPGDRLAQVQVSRNHVSGYRNETSIYGEEGAIHVGHFAGDWRQVELAVYRPRAVVERRALPLRDYGPGVPVFVERFGPAYKAELAWYLDRCLDGAPFGIDHTDGLTALEVVAAGARSLRGGEQAVTVEYSRG